MHRNSHIAHLPASETGDPPAAAAEDGTDEGDSDEAEDEEAAHHRIPKKGPENTTWK